ncbi:MAG: adenosine deaminase [Betaproteobacteria bacterium]|nr:adenosine deaminase [Betaproteobacteria bacterium]
MPQSNRNNDQEARLRALPKAEIHLHVEGCFDAATLEQLAASAGEAMPRPREALLQFSSLADFLHFLDWACGLIRTREQLAQTAYALAQRMAASGTGYADAIINPSHWRHWRGRVPEMVDALDEGFKAAEQDGLPPVGLCISLLRTASAEAAAQLVDQLIAMRHPRVVALSIDGNEATAGRTGPRFAEAFRRAGAAGLKRTVHAGESSGPEGVRDAIELLGADRIDHGVRAAGDAELVSLLADKGIPLGICPGSNLSLGVFASMAEHPIDRLRLAGVPVSVNTDDPALFDTTLEREYARCITAYGWDNETVRAVARTSIEASFANADIKDRLLRALAGW